MGWSYKVVIFTIRQSCGSGLRRPIRVSTALPTSIPTLLNTVHITPSVVLLSQLLFCSAIEIS